MFVFMMPLLVIVLILQLNVRRRGDVSITGHITLHCISMNKQTWELHT